MAFDERTAIEAFWQVHQRGDFFLAEWFDRLTPDQAYRVQLGVAARREAAGERRVG